MNFYLLSNSLRPRELSLKSSFLLTLQGCPRARSEPASLWGAKVAEETFEGPALQHRLSSAKKAGLPVTTQFINH